jgi:glycosyltransferase involved in cell wall biosynthesis
MSDPGPVLMINTERGWRGGESQLHLLVRGLPAAWPTLTVCQPASPLAEALGRESLPCAGLAMGGQLDVAAAWRLCRLARRVGARALHAHTSHGHALALLAAAGTGIPVLVTRRVDFPVKRGLGARWKYGGAVRRFIAVSGAVAAVLAAGGVAPERIAVIRDGVDPDRLAGPLEPVLRRELALPDGAVLVGCVAHLTDHKDHRTLLDAWAAVERRAPQAWLAIVGTGELEAALKAQAATLGLTRVVFTGFRADIPAVLRSCDVFTLSSHMEGLGSSVMDAMLMGLPVVATRAGGIPELVEDGTTGFTVAVRDHRALAEALCRAILDPDLRRRLGEAGRVRADPAFTARRMVEEHMKLYREILP